tara:strand:- start:1958 stop:2191 length:234 start_codon:yes stop_codon:yes gene_type:complete
MPINNYVKDNDNALFLVGDCVILEKNDKVTIIGSPKWRNWTEDGSHDYIYPVVYDNLVEGYVCESRITSLYIRRPIN